MSKTVDDLTPAPGQDLSYTIRVQNSGTLTATQAVISDTLPSGLSFVGPVTIEGSGGTAGPPPQLASGLTIGVGQQITVTVPVAVSSGLSDGTLITNTASVTSSEVITSVSGQVTVTVTEEPSGGSSVVYLPLLFKN